MNSLPHAFSFFNALLFFNLIFQVYDIILTIVAMVHIRSLELTHLITGSFYLGHTRAHTHTRQSTLVSLSLVF